MPNARIMVVEGNRTVAAATISTLKELGYWVTGLAASGESSLDAAQNQMPDLALMNVDLPGRMNALEAADRLERVYKVSSVLLSAGGSADQLDRYLRANPFGLLIAPFSKQQFDAVIRIALEKSATVHRLADDEAKYRVVAEHVMDWETWEGPDGSYRWVSPGCQKATGHSAEQFQRNPDLMASIIHPDDLAQVLAHWTHHLSPIGPQHLYFRIINPGGEERRISHLCRPVFDQEGNWLGRRSCNRDVTAGWSDKEGRKKGDRLAAALAALEDVSGRLPICSVCKKVKSGKGRWEQVEEFISRHSQASFTHDVCPECIKQHFAECGQDLAQRELLNDPPPPRIGQDFE